MSLLPKNGILTAHLCSKFSSLCAAVNGGRKVTVHCMYPCDSSGLILKKHACWETRVEPWRMVREKSPPPGGIQPVRVRVFCAKALGVRLTFPLIFILRALFGFSNHALFLLFLKGQQVLSRQQGGGPFSVFFLNFETLVCFV